MFFGTVCVNAFLKELDENDNKRQVRYDHIILNAREGERLMINDMKPDGLVTAYVPAHLRCLTRNWHAINTKRDRFCRTEFITDRTMGTRYD